MKQRQKCNKCGYEWESNIENPKQCPKCKSYEWAVSEKDKLLLDPEIGKYYIKEKTKELERNFASAHKKKIIQILGDKCACGKKAVCYHHTQYKGLKEYHNDLKAYCKFLKPNCSKCHGKEPRTDYHKELGLSKQEYTSKIREYEQLVNTNKYFKMKINLSICKDLFLKLEKVKDFPQWKGNRSSVVEAALEDFLEKPNMISKQKVKEFIYLNQKLIISLATKKQIENNPLLKKIRNKIKELGLT